MLKNTLILFNFLLFTLNSLAINSPGKYTFERFQYTDKLPSNSVIRIYQDKEGYMWFGTKDGLCRFDGYDIKVFRSSALTPGKLTNNEIQCIAEDNRNQIWVGTFEGISIIDKKNYSIRQFDNNLTKKERINSIMSDSKGHIWIATSNYGVLRINPETGKFVRFSNNNDSPLKLAGNNVTQIFEDKSGRIWISLWKKGLCYIEQNLKQIRHLPSIGSSNNPFRLFQDKDGIFWICTWGDGIYQLSFDNKDNIRLHPINISKNSTKKVDNIVYSITQDKKYGYIWVVTFSGLSLIEKEKDNTYKVMDSDAFFDGSTSKLFHEIYKSDKGDIWIGSVGEGLYKLDFHKISILNFPLGEIKKQLNTPPYVTRMCESTSEVVYIAINRVGLFCFNTKTGEVIQPSNPIIRSIHSISALVQVSQSKELWIANEGEDIIHVFRKKGKYDLELRESFSLSNSNLFRENTITSLFEDSNGNIWIGTSNGLFLKTKSSPAKLISSKIQFVNTISEDSNKRIWVGTEKEGAFVCKPQHKGKQISYSFAKIRLNIDSYQSFSVQSICCKKNGEVYIGTKEGCIYLYDQQKQNASDISGSYSITDEGILNIVEDNYGMLWISTIKRIIRFNPITHTSTYHSTADGMLVSSFFKDASVKLKSGQILFGGNNGICAFNPASYNSTPKPRKQNVVISDILIQNKSIFDDSEKTHYNARNNRITLDHNESNLNIEFSALNYSSPGKIQYAYKLSGADNDWSYVGNNQRFVNYTNLPSGKYKFMVKASDENGLWSNGITSVEIVILPPPYRSWWAYLIYMVILASITYFVARIVINRIRLRNELRISHIEKEKSEELAQIKLRYFTNISHELLTPLTIIMLLIENLQKKNNNEEATQFEIMKANVNRLKRLIQQILVFRKTESGNMKLNIRQNDIIAFVKSICHSNFQPLIKEKEISFIIDSELESYLAYFDPDKLDKVLYNLLSNAFKHTPKGGTISVKISFPPRGDNYIMRLSVCDTGSGIAGEDLPNIFKRFYISTSSDQSQSHGIGLSLTSDLLDLHKGSIEVKSQIGEGSVFTIEIPVSKNAYTEEELSEAPDEEKEKLSLLMESSEIILSDNEAATDTVATETDKDRTILIVEDNPELRTIIVAHLENRYQVLFAENGVRALEIMRDKEIDLVISDVMMPEMDGLTLCKLIKNDISTSHIGVLILTAKNSTEDRIDCYNAGADSYIAKPFELSLLEARARNLLSKRKQKTESFQSNQEINISAMEYGSIDEEFLNLAVRNVEDYLDDVTFDFDQFAEYMGTSKSTLHRKLKSLTGLSPGEFIRSIRLKHAAKMLKNNAGNISDIAFAVGFNDPKYFSRCFKTEFGQTPREYQDSNK